MNSEEIRKAVNSILSELHLKYDNGVKGRGIENYELCVEALNNILATGEANSDVREYVEAAIKQFQSYMGLGVVVKDNWKQIDPNICARHNINVGDYIGGHKLAVVTKMQFDLKLYPKSTMLVDGTLMLSRRENVASVS